VLERHQFWSVRNAKRDYLLRGLMVCGLCGYHYVGAGGWYHCLARRRASRLWGRELGAIRRCHALPLKAAKIEADIWADVERYVRHPDEALAQLAAKQSGQADRFASLRADLATKQQEQAGMQDERDRIVTTYRKGTITERDMSRQLSAIAKEEAALAQTIADLTRELAAASDVAAKLSGAEALLRSLRGKLDSGPLTHERRRAIVEQLVEDMVVKLELDEATGKDIPVVYVQYCFDDPDAADVRRNGRGPSDVNAPAYTMVCKLPRRQVEK
jgi:site-specific DNA recombinase